MKQIIRRWMLIVGMMLLHTQIILAQQSTQLSNEDFNVEGWMFIGAGIAICLAVTLLFFLNKFFTKECISSGKKKAPKVQSKAQVVKQTQQAKQTNKTMAKAEKSPVAAQKTKVPAKRVAETSHQTALEQKMPKQEMPLEKSVEVVQLELMEESDNSKSIRFCLKDQVTLGRNPQHCNIAIADDLAVSGMHCKIYIYEGKIYVMDLGSTNGTYVNGKKIQYAVVLKGGDYIEIGSREYRISWS